MSSDLRDVLAPARPITRTIGGKEYGFPRTIEARFGILLADGVNDTKNFLDYIDEDEQFDIRDVLMGPARKDMIRDRVTDEELNVVFTYLTMYHLYGETAADSYWDGLGKPLTPRDDVGPSTTSPSTGADAETKPPASTSGTSTPRKTSSSRKKPPASRSRGR